DEFYTCTATVGNGQSFTFDLDTGSSDVWIRGPACTSSDGSCGSSGQASVATSDKAIAKQAGAFSITYGTGKVQGAIYKGPVSIGGRSATMNFGVTATEQGFSGVGDGLWGLAYPSLNSISNGNFISAANIHTLSFYFSDSSEKDYGELVIDGVDSAKYSGQINYG
ncbi:Type I transmembrane sorting receptor, partial [Entophlyctis sp. JEL0112]